MIILKTNRLILREYSEKDFKTLHKILSDKITMSFLETPFSLDQTNEWISKSIASYKQYGFGRLAVLTRENNNLIGDCGIMKNSIDGKKGNDLGYIFHHTNWGTGYATEAASVCLKYAFDKLKIKRICANMAYDHIASKCVAEKTGMKKEKEFYSKKNRNILTYLYSITQE